ncbi:MAG TPA: lacto-N-biose phosphorylase central domain-containing protein, partial [Clostridia bacterium]
HLADEFRTVKALHSRGKPYDTSLKVAVLTAWGQLRAWACCGHFNHGNPYNEAMESLSGLPVETVLISFDDIIAEGIPEDIDVILNAGRLGDAWSGARHWENPQVVSILTGWVARGGGLIGIADATAAAGKMDYFQLAEVFGVEKETGLTPMFTKAQPALIAGHYITAMLSGRAPTLGQTVSGVYPLGSAAAILAVEGKDVVMAANAFHQGRSVYLAGYVHSNENTRLLEQAIRWAARRENESVEWTSTNCHVECAFFPDAGQLAVINNSTVPQTAVIPGGGRDYSVQLEPYGLQLIDIPQ